jgi:hypothetical protein
MTPSTQAWFAGSEPVVSGKSICMDLQGFADIAVHCR